ncbi:hypothetical protein AKJ16_DCAP00082 [Drosera capensis]
MFPMNASQFMDKQIMDLSRSKSTTIDSIHEVVDDQVPETTERDAVDCGGGVGEKSEIFPSYDFQPIRPVVGVSTQFDGVGVGSGGVGGGGNRSWGSMDSASALIAGLKVNSDYGYGYLDSVVPDKVILDKAQNMNHSTLVSEIDRTLQKHTDNLIHSLDGLSNRVSQLENRMGQLENTLDDLKVIVGNGQGSTDGKMRHLENILREVQSGVQHLKDKQEVMDAQILLAKLGISKEVQAPENRSDTQHIDPIQRATSASQQLSPQFPVALEASLPALPPPNVPLPPPQNTVHPPVPMPAQFPQGQTPTLPPRDQYFPHPSQTNENPHQQFQFPPSQFRQPTPPEHQLVARPPPTLYNQHPSAAPVNVPPRPQASPLGYQPEETSYVTPQIYPPNLQQPQPTVVTTKQFYNAPPSHPNEPNMGRSSSGFQSGYIPAQGTSEQYPYSGSPSRYDSGSSFKPSSLPSSMGNPNYPIPTAKLLPQAIPTASTVSGSSGSGGTGNRVPIDDVIDKVTSMGFPRDHVRATVKKLTENGQSVDLNVVLDKLMNEGGMQPQRGWFGR